MSSELKAQFTLPWKIKWSDFEELSTKKITKQFITPYNNIVLHWRAELNTSAERTKAGNFNFFMYYEDGPTQKVNGVSYTIAIMKPKEILKVSNVGNYTYEQDDVGNGILNYDVISWLGAKCGLDYLTLQITLKIPVFAFTSAQCYYGLSWHEQKAFIFKVPAWITQLFQCIDDREPSSLSDCKLKSRDDFIYYGHQLILAAQSEVLAAMFRHPPPTDGEYPFPSLGSPALKGLLEFLYTSRVSFDGLSTKSIIEIADAAEQYGLKLLKKLCATKLWEMAVEKSDECFEIIQFADLHQDMKYVKDRLMDVLADNYEKMGLESEDLIVRFGGNEQGNRLKKEFNLFFARRLTPLLFMEDK